MPVLLEATSVIVGEGGIVKLVFSEHCLCIIVKIYIPQTNPKEVWISRSYLVMPFEK